MCEWVWLGPRAPKVLCPTEVVHDETGDDPADRRELVRVVCSRCLFRVHYLRSLSSLCSLLCSRLSRAGALWSNTSARWRVSVFVTCLVFVRSWSSLSSRWSRRIFWPVLSGSLPSDPASLLSPGPVIDLRSVVGEKGRGRGVLGRGSSLSLNGTGR